MSVTFSNALTSLGGSLPKIGAGTLTLAGLNTYSGLTTVSGGKLAISGTNSGTGNITVADGAALIAYENGAQITPATLTLGTISGAALEFNNVASTTLAPFAPGTIVTAGTTVTINVNNGNFNTIGQVFPLITWSSGSPPAVTLGVVNGAVELSTNGNTDRATITATPLTWTGLNHDGAWDLATLNNWENSSGSAKFVNGVPTVFDDTATGTLAINIGVGYTREPHGQQCDQRLQHCFKHRLGHRRQHRLDQGWQRHANALRRRQYLHGRYTVGGGTLSVSSLANGGSPATSAPRPKAPRIWCSMAGRCNTPAAIR